MTRAGVAACNNDHTFPPHPSPNQAQALTEGHLRVASAADCSIIGSSLALYAFGSNLSGACAFSSGLNLSSACAFSFVSVVNQSGSAGSPLRMSGMTTRYGTEAASRSTPRSVGSRKPKASKMLMMARSEVPSPVMSVDAGCEVSLARTLSAQQVRSSGSAYSTPDRPRAHTSLRTCTRPRVLPS